ncbi:hypothetical protein CAL14_03935 [Bordetella genomosp. 9]|nr:hypothetical protein CAL14_03935 [Bordetella genomosp. 9]
MDIMAVFFPDRAAMSAHFPDALARAELLSGDPVLDRRLAVLAEADPLGLRVPRRTSAADLRAVLADLTPPERQSYRIGRPAPEDCNG